MTRTAATRFRPHRADRATSACSSATARRRVVSEGLRVELSMRSVPTSRCSLHGRPERRVRRARAAGHAWRGGPTSRRRALDEPLPPFGARHVRPLRRSERRARPAQRRPVRAGLPARVAADALPHVPLYSAPRVRCRRRWRGRADLVWRRTRSGRPVGRGSSCGWAAVGSATAWPTRTAACCCRARCPRRASPRVAPRRRPASSAWRWDVSLRAYWNAAHHAEPVPDVCDGAGPTRGGLLQRPPVVHSRSATLSCAPAGR